MAEDTTAPEGAEGEAAPEDKPPQGNPHREGMDAIAAKVLAQREAEMNPPETQEIDDPADDAPPADDADANPPAKARVEKEQPAQPAQPVQTEARAIPVKLPDGRVLYLNQEQAAVALQHGVSSIIHGGAQPQQPVEDKAANVGKGNGSPGISDEDVRSVVNALRYGDEDDAEKQFTSLVKRLADQQAAANPGLTMEQVEQRATQAVERRLAEQNQMNAIAQRVTTEFPQVFENSEQGQKLQELATMYRDRLKAEMDQGRARTLEGNPITDKAGLFHEAARRAAAFATTPRSDGDGPTLNEKEQRKMQTSTPRPGLKQVRKPADPDASLSVEQRMEKDRRSHIAQMRDTRRTGVAIPR